MSAAPYLLAVALWSSFSRTVTLCSAGPLRCTWRRSFVWRQANRACREFPRGICRYRTAHARTHHCFTGTGAALLLPPSRNWQSSRTTTHRPGRFGHLRPLPSGRRSWLRRLGCRCRRRHRTSIRLRRPSLTLSLCCSLTGRRRCCTSAPTAPAGRRMCCCSRCRPM